MIYQLELPDLTRNCLTDIIHLQMWFLRYASSRTYLDQTSCQTYFERHPKFRGRHTKIARWLWHGKREKFLELLEKFAQGSNKDKREWSRHLSREVFMFLNNPIGFIEPFDSDSAPEWQAAGAEFLRKFYDYLGNGNRKFPEYFFSAPGAKKFGRIEFLFRFRELNHITQCPACDIEPFSRIDHYLPKGLYPHFSCHPFNLVPVCNTCNSDTKGEINFLIKPSGDRRNLEVSFLPYRGYGLKAETYLEINLEKGYRKPLIVDLNPLNGKVLLERVDTCRDLYSIPTRWSEKTSTIDGLVYSQVERSINAYLATTQTGRGDLNIFGIRNLFDDLISSFWDKQGQESWLFAMTWCLIAWVNQEIEPAINEAKSIKPGDDYPLLQYLIKKLNQPDIPHPACDEDPRRVFARHLRKTAKNSS